MMAQILAESSPSTSYFEQYQKGIGGGLLSRPGSEEMFLLSHLGMGDTRARISCQNPVPTSTYRHRFYG